VRAVVLCAEPERARDERDSLVSVLADLGGDLSIGRLDLGGLDLPALTRTPPDVVVVDAGDELLIATRTIRKLRASGPLVEVPVLLALTLARLPALDFSVGFDDFVLQPLVPAELYARLRQLDWRTAAFGSDEVIKLDELVIDLAGHEARLGGRKLELTHQEFELLKFLAQHRGRAFTREQLLERVWGYRYAGGTRTVDIHVRRVRAKLGPALGGLIETVRNLGYKLRAGR
jgi:DNA-binding response OmpR family regulator